MRPLGLAKRTANLVCLNLSIIGWFQMERTNFMGLVLGPLKVYTI